MLHESSQCSPHPRGWTGRGRSHDYCTEASTKNSRSDVPTAFPHYAFLNPANPILSYLPGAHILLVGSQDKEIPSTTGKYYEERERKKEEQQQRKGDTALFLIQEFKESPMIRHHGPTGIWAVRMVLAKRQGKASLLLTRYKTAAGNVDEGQNQSQAWKTLWALTDWPVWVQGFKAFQRDKCNDLAYSYFSKALSIPLLQALRVHLGGYIYQNIKSNTEISKSHLLLYLIIKLLS